MHAGQLIAGRYRLEEEAGSGGIGVVWRAVDQKRGRDVALKRAARGTGTDGERTLRRLRREAQIAAGLHHPHIVAFIDEMTEGPERWLVLEYVPSDSLAQLLERTGPLRPQHATHIGAQIASALEAVHARGIVHRDVKPGNILVTADGIAKLTDFGISRPIYGDVTITDSAVINRNEPRVPTTTVAGQDFYIMPEADGPDCVAEVRHRRTLDANRALIDEVVMVTVTGLRPADQLCGPGRELVQAVAAKLRLSR